jgi:hypothetical protein
MKKFVSLLAVLFAAISLNGADTTSVGVDVGYNNNYIVNGVSVAKDSGYAGLNAFKSLKYADVYAGTVLVADGSNDQSHWLFGAGKNLYTIKDFTARADASVQRHQTSSIGIVNSTEFGVKLSVPNKWVTPYVRGAFNVELEQNGYFFGAERAQKLLWGTVVTPSVEWGKSTSYEAYNVKATLTRPVTFAWGTVTPYAEVGLYNNNVFDNGPKVYALTRFDNDVVYSAGLKLSF